MRAERGKDKPKVEPGGRFSNHRTGDQHGRNRRRSESSLGSTREDEEKLRVQGMEAKADLAVIVK